LEIVNNPFTGNSAGDNNLIAMMAGSFIIFIGTLVSGIYNFVCALFTKKAQD
jgi:hypothetical protein